jgi:hypothetical protein
MMPIRKVLLVLSCALLLLFECSSGIVDGGSGTLTTNGICVASHNGTLSGYVFTIDPFDSLREIPVDTIPLSLQLFSADYRPYDTGGFGRTPVLDSSGSFTCDSLESGRYTMLAYDTSNSTGVFLGDIPVGDSAGEYSVRKFFTPCGTVRGVIHDTSAMQADFRGAYIVGTPFFDLADSIGAFSFLHVPSGVYTIKADYFTMAQDSACRRAKGFIRSVDDTLVIYTDSIEVDLRSDTLVHHVELSL